MFALLLYVYVNDNNASYSDMKYSKLRLIPLQTHCLNEWDQIGQKGRPVVLLDNTSVN